MNKKRRDPRQYRAPSDYQNRILAFVDAQDEEGVSTDDVVKHLTVTKWKAQRDLMRLVDRGFIDARSGRYYVTPKAETILSAPAA